MTFGLILAVLTHSRVGSHVQLFETVVFFCIGASTALYLRHIHVGFTCAVIIGCMIGRLASVCGLSVPLNMHAERKSRLVGGVAKVITRSQQIVLWCGGLRGAVAFALVLSFPSPWRPNLIGTVAWIVFATTLIGGAGTPPLLDYLGMSHSGGGATDGEGGHTHLEESFGDLGLETLVNGDAGEMPADASTFARQFRKLELKLLATGSTEAARAAAKLAARVPGQHMQSSAAAAEATPTAPSVAQPPPRSQSPRSYDHGADAAEGDEKLDRNWSTAANADGFTDVAIDRESPQRGRAGSPQRSTLEAAREANRSRARNSSGSASSRSEYDPAALTQTASAAQRQRAYSGDADGVRP